MKKLILALILFIFSVPSAIYPTLTIKTSEGLVTEYADRQGNSLLKSKIIVNLAQEPIIELDNISYTTLQNCLMLLEQHTVSQINYLLHHYEVDELFEVIQALSFLDMPALLNLACKAWSDNYELVCFENNAYKFESPAILETLEMLRLIKSHFILKNYSHKIEIVEQRAPTVPTAYSPDGNKLVSGSYGHNAYVFDLRTGKDLFALPHLGKVRSITFSPDGCQIASCGDYYAYLWDAATGQCMYQFNRHMDPVYSVCFNPDGTLLASAAGDTNIGLWDSKTGECVQMFYGHENAVRSICFSPDGSKIASGSSDNTIRIWDISTGQCLRLLCGHKNRINALTFSHDGIFLASGSEDGSLRIWDIAAEKCVSVLEEHQGPVYSVSFSPDGSMLRSSSKDNTACIWDISEPIKNELSYQQLLLYTLIAYNQDPLDLRNNSRLLEVFYTLPQKEQDDLYQNAKVKLPLQNTLLRQFNNHKKTISTLGATGLGCLALYGCYKMFNKN